MLWIFRFVYKLRRIWYARRKNLKISDRSFRLFHSEIWVMFSKHIDLHLSIKFLRISFFLVHKFSFSAACIKFRKILGYINNVAFVKWNAFHPSVCLAIAREKSFQLRLQAAKSSDKKDCNQVETSKTFQILLCLFWKREDFFPFLMMKNLSKIVFANLNESRKGLSLSRCFPTSIRRWLKRVTRWNHDCEKK